MLHQRLRLSFFCITCVLFALALFAWRQSAQNTAAYLFLFCAAGMAALTLVSIRLWSRSARAIEIINDRLQQINVRWGPEAPRWSCSNPHEALFKITEELPQWVARLEAERDGLKAILTTMEEGVIVVDAQKRILVANAAARKILDMPESNPMGVEVNQVTSNPDLLANIDLAVSSSQVCSFEFKHPASGPDRARNILARCAPLHDGTRNLSGAVAVLHDISELRRLERMRTEFVANVSHELRTPLTSLLGYLETLEQGGWEDIKQSQEFLRICQRQAENLSRIVEDLLRLSKLENPQQDIANADIDLVEVVNASIEQCLHLIKTRKVAVNTQLPVMAVVVRGDRGLLVQAISNLVENAVNYNRENGSVQVRLSPLRRSGSLDPECQWEIAIADTGIGIPQAALKHVFERFYRVDKARSRDRGGTGLGLAIVKHIALAHGASVHVESEAGKGSTFFMRFKAKAHETASLAASD